MELSLPANLQRLRKARGMTQEQLAAAMGVSTGAVSKWENGLSNPDLNLIPELAELFAVSVDVLLGYAGRSRRELVQRLRSLDREKDFETGSQLAEGALHRYPGSFDVVYTCAQLYSHLGLERGDRGALRKAEECLQRAIGLFEQNTDPALHREELMIELGETIGQQGRYSEAVSLLEQTNIRGVNNYTLGFWYTQLGEYDKADEVLSEQLIGSVLRLVSSGTAWVTALAARELYQPALDYIGWLRQMMGGLLPEEGPSVLTKLAAALCAMEAVLHAAQGHPEEARAALMLARDEARRFDAQPDYLCRNIRFYRSHKPPQTIYDNGGETALECVGRLLQEGAGDAPPRQQLLRMWEELQ